MADLTIAAGGYPYEPGATTQRVTTGAVITAGSTIYLDSSSLAQLSDANASATTGHVDGIATHTADNGAGLTILVEGTLTLGGTQTIGTVLVQSANAGKIAPVGDLATGHYVSTLGVVVNATQASIKLLNSGVQVP